MQRCSGRGKQVTRNSIGGQLGQIGVEYIHQQCTTRDAWLLNNDQEHFCGRDALKLWSGLLWRILQYCSIWRELWCDHVPVQRPCELLIFPMPIGLPWSYILWCWIFDLTSFTIMLHCYSYRYSSGPKFQQEHWPMEEVSCSKPCHTWTDWEGNWSLRHNGKSCFTIVTLSLLPPLRQASPLWAWIHHPSQWTRYLSFFSVKFGLPCS